MCGSVVAQFLAYTVRTRKCQRVLELGTFTGYSTVALASGLVDPKSGTVESVEINAEFAGIAEKNVQSYRESLEEPPTINIHAVKAHSYLSEFLTREDKDKEPFDLVFVDANKSEYHSYYSFILDNNMLSENGCMVFDNVLFKGLVLPDASSLEDFAKIPKRLYSVGDKLRNFAQFVKDDPRTTQQLLPIRDGLLLI
eukprot:CAMPEP_0206198082 /NCGR_PEP_ID=MMETSP0166-20121206/9424_1 /ASSEMBLY_ACC=CAM_ASM_000260 /TAXON_ID=95228 /ORGANISM="Vannella robusta, Strain DIVA3 518/3/11/1/6" /LENGTH=196 /DNA_ID=CAMNT_0053615865 /DNA_START=170 /DNA_END=757 /DNA_ORIENTATION=-